MQSENVFIFFFLLLLIIQKLRLLQNLIKKSEP